MTLPPRIPKPQKRASRWRCQPHVSFVKKHACCKCGSMQNIEGAHVRLGSHTGMGQTPDDWRVVSLCVACHRHGRGAQHDTGERTFWRGIDVEALIAAFIKASPRRREIETVMAERQQRRAA